MAETLREVQHKGFLVLVDRQNRLHCRDCRMRREALYVPKGSDRMVCGVCLQKGRTPPPAPASG